MNILLINPPRYNSVPVFREWRCEYISTIRIDPPATLLHIASLLRESGHNVDLIDANAHDLGFDEISTNACCKSADCVIFPIAGFIIEHDVKLASTISKINPSCINVAYSWYSRRYAQEILKEFPDLDVFVTGQAFSVIRALADCLSTNADLDRLSGIAYRKKGTIKASSGAEHGIALDKLPMPAYDLLDSFKPYYLFDRVLRPYALIYSGQGCPFSCKYCVIAKTGYSAKTIDRTIEELKLLKELGNIRYVSFHDEVFTIDKMKTVQLCERIIDDDIKIKWFCTTRVELVDDKLLKVMRRAGCIGIQYGAETGSQELLNSMNKGNTVQQAKQALKWTRKAHILAFVNLLLGFVGEDETTLKKTEDFVKQALPQALMIYAVHAHKGTEFGDAAIQNRWVEEVIDWKEELKRGYRLSSYPFYPNIEKQRKKMMRILRYSPKWWIISANLLLRNPALLLASSAIYARDLQTHVSRQQIGDNLVTLRHGQ